MGGAPENKQFLISNKHLNSNVVYVLSKGFVFMAALWWAICSKNMDMMRAAKLQDACGASWPRKTTRLSRTRQLV